MTHPDQPKPITVDIPVRSDGAIMYSMMDEFTLLRLIFTDIPAEAELYDALKSLVEAVDSELCVFERSEDLILVTRAIAALKNVTPPEQPGTSNTGEE